MFSSDAKSPTIGQRNIEAAEALLTEFSVPIVARHLGGEQGRRMTFNPESGRVTIQIVGADPIEI